MRSIPDYCMMKIRVLWSLSRLKITFLYIILKDIIFFSSKKGPRAPMKQELMKEAKIFFHQQIKEKIVLNKESASRFIELMK